jgi:hypothetical protein
MASFDLSIRRVSFWGKSYFIRGNFSLLLPPAFRSGIIGSLKGVMRIDYDSKKGGPLSVGKRRIY